MESAFSSTSGDSVAEKFIIEYTNYERKRAGVPELRWDVRCNIAARQHAAEMLRLEYFSHTSPIKEIANPQDRTYHAGLSDDIVGENIALHSEDRDAQGISNQLLKQWMESPGHRANILNVDFTHLGVGVVSVKDSVVKDSLIRGTTYRIVRYKIRHIGVQVFVQRKIDFKSLRVVRKDVESLFMSFTVDWDRPILVQVDTWSRVFGPINSKVPIQMDIPQNAEFINIAKLQDAQALEYVRVLGCSVRPMDSLRSDFLKVGISDLSVSPRKKSMWLLEGLAAIDNSESGNCMIRLDDETYWMKDIANRELRFEIPINEGRQIRFGLGGSIKKTIWNEIRFDLSELERPNASTKFRLFKKIYDDERTSR